MALSFLNAGTVFKTPSGGAASTFTANVPASPAPSAGDLLLAVGLDWAGSGVTWTTPSGWSLVISKNDGATQDVGVHVYSKVATGTDPNQNFTLSSAESGLMVMVAYTGQDGTTPVDVSGGTATDTTTSLIAPSVTTTVANDILLFIFGVGSDVTAPSALSTPTGATLRVPFNTIPGSSASQAFMLADLVQASAGASATATSTLTGASGTYGTVAIAVAVKAPAAGGGSGLPFFMQQDLLIGQFQTLAGGFQKRLRAARSRTATYAPTHKPRVLACA